MTSSNFGQCDPHQLVILKRPYYNCHKILDPSPSETVTTFMEGHLRKSTVNPSYNEHGFEQHNLLLFIVTVKVFEVIARIFVFYKFVILKYNRE